MSDLDLYTLPEFPAPWNKIFAILSRLFVWGLLFLIIFLLRSFFLLVFITFVFAYIQAHGVEFLSPHIKNRSLRVALIGVIFLGVLVSIGLFVVPKVVEQAKIVADRYQIYLTAVDQRLSKIITKYPSTLELFPSDVRDGLENLDIATWSVRKSPSAMIFQEMFGFGGGSNTKKVNGLKHSLEALRNLGRYLLAIGSAFFLALLFSFLIVFDLPRLKKSVAGLAETRIGFIYEEVADSIREFGQEIGHSLVAQLYIAILNTFLTAFVIIYLGLKSKLALLSLCVFVCSFIPVAGVFISSVPICLFAIQEGGASAFFMAALAIWVVHMIEAYILNPKIYGHRFRINPVFVLIILTIGGKLFHLWGLVLSIPVCTYFFRCVIRRRRA